MLAAHLVSPGGEAALPASTTLVASGYEFTLKIKGLFLFPLKMKVSIWLCLPCITGEEMTWGLEPREPYWGERQTPVPSARAGKTPACCAPSAFRGAPAQPGESCTQLPRGLANSFAQQQGLRPAVARSPRFPASHQLQTGQNCYRNVPITMETTVGIHRSEAQMRTKCHQSH